MIFQNLTNLQLDLYSENVLGEKFCDHASKKLFLIVALAIFRALEIQFLYLVE
jgi:hypothetical protein